MHHFPCTPDCPLEIYADWLEDHGIDPGEIRLLAVGWSFFGHGTSYGAVSVNGYGNSDGYHYGYGDGCGEGNGLGYCEYYS